MTTPETKPPEPKVNLLAWRKLVAGIASLLAGGSAMSSSGATMDDLAPLLDKGGLFIACAAFAYLAWTQLTTILRDGIAVLWSIRASLADMGTKQAEMQMKQVHHDSRFEAVDDRLANVDRRLEDINKTLSDKKLPA